VSDYHAKGEPRCRECKHWGELRGNELHSDGTGARGFLKLHSGVTLGRCNFPGGHRAICRDGTKTQSHEGAPTYESGPLSRCTSFAALTPTREADGKL
jgi:hypothetical protein